MEFIHFMERPALRRGTLITAFTGWNDAAEVATQSLRFCIQSWEAQKFAEIDPEEFYDFMQVRPLVHLEPDLTRELEWPANEFYYHVDPARDRDLMLLVGIEPQLKWRTFANTILDVAQECGVAMVLSLGGLLAPVPHTRPVRFTGTGSEAGLARRLRELGVGLSRYQGPTGIIGVLHDACRKRGLPAASIWGNVPHYLGGARNPKVMAALLDRLNMLLDLNLDLSSFGSEIIRFEAQVDAALAMNSEAAAYVRQLEEVESQEGEAQRAGSPPLPSGEAVVKELEEFLREQFRKDKESD